MVGAGRERSEPPSSARAGRGAIIPPQHLRRALVDSMQTPAGASSSAGRGRGKTKRGAARGGRGGGRGRKAVVPSSPPSLLPVPSPLRSSPKRLPESLFGLPVPPAKKASIHGGRGRAEDQSDSVLGAPPVRQVLSPQPSATSGMGAFTVPASTGRGRTLDGSSPFGSATSQGGYHRYRYSRWDIPPARGYGGLCSNMHGVMCNRACSSTWKRDIGKGMHVDMGEHCPRIQTAMKKQDDFSSSGQGNTLDLRNDQVGENMELNVGMDTRVAESFPRAAAHGPNAPRAP